MKTKAEFIDAWQMEMYGLLMLSFHEANKDTTNFNTKDIGKQMIFQMRKAREMLSRMFDEMSLPLPLKPTETKT